MSQFAADDRRDLACPQCGSVLDGLRCTGCGAEYRRVLGVPFLGAFEGEDALGLIEIAANAPNRASLPVDPQAVERLDALCSGYQAAADKDAFRAANPEAQAWWFGHRYSEWVAVETLLDGTALAGRDVLDIGAGPGFDAWRLALRGARVTALEFSPILTEAGLKSFPSIRWIGGFSHALPFADASFDFVFINAALHHMRDIPASIAEALRVLRPGGTLITTGDPFRSDAFGPSHEFDIFDRHEAVLLGINEQIPRASDFLATLERHRGVLAPELFTQMLHGGRLGKGPDLTDWTAWDLDADSALLKARSGSLAMRVRLTAPWPAARHLQTAGILDPATFAAWLDEPERAVAELARIMPRAYLDTPFPGAPAKFDLLNGWRVARSTPTTRTAYRRARLFRTRAAAPVLRFEIRAATPAAFTFHANAQPAGAAEVGTDWTPVEVDVSAVPPHDPFVLELRREGERADFNAGCFDVRLPDARARFGAGLADWLRTLVPGRWRRRVTAG
ncbi:class I SAM-dependent methyltransferase [Roseomonas fluvialis]|uniref:Methyltransferase type 11 domain-containing protein n=1 Tax=Roseomonas fluvialis TaxID=1750527 RepID=A0ABN6NXX5_9PROT|nr:class I SAM-dependent methyltransferase [Roseomonas fluvialis]BDG70905.1 hypothetical protein Rmf_08340 [Roseomonas fluvialis]